MAPAPQNAWDSWLCRAEALFAGKLMKVTVFLLQCLQPALLWTNSRNAARRWESGTLPSIKTYTGLRYAGEAQPPPTLPSTARETTHLPTRTHLRLENAIWRLSRLFLEISQSFRGQSCSLLPTSQRGCPAHLSWIQFMFLLRFFSFRYQQTSRKPNCRYFHLEPATEIREGEPGSPPEFTKPIPRTTLIKEKLVLINEI